MRLAAVDSGRINSDDIRRIGPPLPESARGTTLANWLVRNYLFYGPEAWLQEIIGGRITVNQFVVDSPNLILEPGHTLGRLHPLSEEPDVDTSLQILWRDDDVAVVSKPAGLAMHEAAYFRRKTVHWILPRLLNGDWHAVHRLDRETSGILLCARGPKLRRVLAQGLQHGKFKKSYLALCHGQPIEDHWIDCRPLVPANSSKAKASCLREGEPREGSLSAETHFWVRARFEGRCLVEAEPKTGRTHQIRVHLTTSGHPIVGDKVYGPNPDVFDLYIRDGNTAEVQALAGSPHHLLHAWKITFIHPLSGQELSFTDDNNWGLTPIVVTQ